MTFDLFPFQHETVNALVIDLREIRQGLIAHATGTGKTVIGGATLHHEYHYHRDSRQDFRGLWLSQTDELVQQPLDKLSRIFQQELAEGKITLGKVQSDKGHDFQADIISASIQSLSDDGHRLRRILEFGDITHVVWDEAHHCAAPTYIALDQALRETCPGHKKWGQTATPERHDERSLSTVFDAIYRKGRYTYIYPIWTAIEQGYLAPFKPKELLTVDISKVKFVGDEPNAEQMMRLYKTGNWPKLLQEGMEKYGGLELPTLVFMPTVDIAEAFAMWMSDEVGIPYGFIAGRGAAMALNGKFKTADRADVIAAFQRGDLAGITNMKALTEGVDLPHIQRVILGRPTSSDVDSAQMIGRGLRTHPGKAFCHLLTVGWSGRPLPNYGNILFGGQEHRDRDKLEKILKQLSGAKATQVHYICMECLQGTMALVDESRDLYECSKCGAQWQPGDIVEEETDLTKLLFDERAIQGKSVYARTLDLTSKSKAAWYTYKQGFSFGLGIGLDGAERIIYVGPPGTRPDMPEKYCLAIIKRNVSYRYKLTDRSESEQETLKEAWDHRPADLVGEMQWWKQQDDPGYDCVATIFAAQENIDRFLDWAGEWELLLEEMHSKKYTPWIISAKGNGDAPADLMMKAEAGSATFWNAKLAKKSEGWRSRNASVGQIKWAKQMIERLRLEIKLRPDLSRGAMAQIINHCLVTECLREKGWVL